MAQIKVEMISDTSLKGHDAHHGPNANHRPEVEFHGGGRGGEEATASYRTVVSGPRNLRVKWKWYTRFGIQIEQRSTSWMVYRGTTICQEKNFSIIIITVTTLKEIMISCIEAIAIILKVKEEVVLVEFSDADDAVHLIKEMIIILYGMIV